MKVILALGNHGDKYARTRHNAGWQLAEHLRVMFGLRPWTTEKRWQATAARGHVAGKAVLVVRPMTYMNRSGESLAAVLGYFSVAAGDLLVVHDDLDLPLGTLRTKQKGGHGGHNGIRDVIRVLGHGDVARLKLGIATEQKNRMPTDAFVLGRFTADEQQVLSDTFADATKRVTDWIAQ